MNKKIKLLQGFTLTELIVVITILAILGTIGFLSFQGYSQNGRNSVRLADTNNLKKILDIFGTEKGLYPVPSGYREITYSGAVAWREGTFGREVNTTLSKTNKPPVDPLTGNEYTYSITANNGDYQIGFAIEGSSIVKSNFVNKTYASNDNLVTSILGSYNGKVLLVSTGMTDYIIASPSIITSDKTSTDIIDIIQNQKLAFKGYRNLPSSYFQATSTGVFSFDFSTTGNNVIYEGKISDLAKQESRLSFYKNLSEIYNNSILEGEDGYQEFSTAYGDVYNPTMKFLDKACRITKELIKINCTSGDDIADILTGSVESGSILPNGKTNYIGQWVIGDINGYGQSLGNANHDRNTMGMSGGLNKALGVKWKIFTKNKSPTLYYGGKDINGDGTEDILYGYGGKIYLGDTISGGNIWETKVLDIKAILGVESIKSNGEKSIIVAIGSDRYLGVINGSNGNLDWISNSVQGPLKTVKTGWPSVDYKVFDIDGDGINEYHFKQRYAKYNSFKFFELSGIVVGETLWSSEGYGDYNEASSDGYQVQQWAMGNISGKLVVGTKGSNTFSFYSNNVDPNLSGNLKYKMPGFGKLITGGNTGNGRSNSLGYFYDINGDGNDEYISRIDEELNNNKLSRIIVGGLTSTGTMTQYTSLSNPRNVGGDGNLISYGNFSTPIALKNQSNPSDSYILSYGKDPVDLSNKWLMLKYNGNSSSSYLKTSSENQSFNYNIVYNTLDPSFSVSGIFNNGTKDYIVLYKSGEFYFYTFNGTSSFSTVSSLKVAGSFYGNTIFDGPYDKIRERNKNAGVFLASYDTDGNGKKEFVVTSGNYFKFYEITDSQVTLVKQFGPYNSIPGVIKWGLTSDKNDIYGISYNSTTNLINYYRTNSSAGDYSFTKKTNDNFYSGGEPEDLMISRLGLGDERYNKLIIGGVGMFDARLARPSSSPIKLSTDYFSSYDMDLDGENEIFISGMAYKYNYPGSYSLKYNYTGWVGDLNGDKVLDQAYAYCGSKPGVPVNLFYTIRSGVDGSQIVPDLDWGNGNGYCSGGGPQSNVSEDYDSDGVDELAAGIAARSTRLISISGSTVVEGNQLSPYAEQTGLVAFDFDGDGKKEIIRGTDSAGVMKGNPLNKTELTNLISIAGGVKSSWGLGGGMPSFYRFKGITYIAFRGSDGQVALKSWNGTSVTNHFNNYYLYTKKYTNSQDIFNAGLVPIVAADVLLGDFIGNDTLQVLVGGGDGYIYILGTDGSIIRAFNIGTSIKKIIFGDTNEDKLLDIVLSSEDGYVYQISSSRLDPPPVISDGSNWSDIYSQTDNKKAGVSFLPSDGATGYFVQLYNKSQKSIVFDWIDIGNITSVCVSSIDYNLDPTCIKANRNFTLNSSSTYEWRVQSYNENISSPTGLSNGFIVVR